MEYVLNITNLILIAVISLMLGLYSYIKFNMRKSYNNKLNTYFSIQKNLSFLSSYFGKVRSGKSSLANAIINTKEMQLMRQCNERMEYIVSLFPKIDFHLINSYLDALHLNDDFFYSNQDIILKQIVKDLEIENCMYNDFINCKTLYEYLEEYIECYYVYYYRGIYVYSKTWRYSYVTRLTSKYLSNETMEIKDIMIQKEFYLRKYSIVYEDELSLTRGNILSHSNLEKNKGRKDIKVLFGHIFQETVYYVSVKQRSDDEISNEKHLYTNYIFIKDREIYNVFQLFLKYFKFKNTILNLKYSILYYLGYLHNRKKDVIYFCMEHYKYRKKKYYNDSCIRYFNSLANVDIRVYDYGRFEDIGKENTETYKRYDEYVWTFDLRDTIGNYNTHEYKILLPLLSSLSKVYDVEYNTHYKSKDLIMRQALFLFDKYIKDENKRRLEEEKANNKRRVNIYDEF